ncbi:MAG: glycosyltransferase [Verrucomicrobiota bacterium]
MTENRRLLILIGGHFANAPRPQKEAAVAVESGFRVTVMGLWTDSTLAREDEKLAESLGVEFEPLLDLTKPSLQGFLARARTRFASFAFQKFNLTLPESYGITARHMFQAAKKLGPDLIMVHSEAGLWAGKRLLDSGYKVGVDFEDWFSEDLPPEARKSRPIYRLKRLEHHLLQHSSLSLATTDAMGNALVVSSGCKRRPVTIPNTFPVVIKKEENSPATDESAPVRFYWFSQTIGPGRGLEPLAQALEEVTGSWELHIRGNKRSYTDWFEETFQDLPEGRVILHSTVPNEELSHASSLYDVGLALENFRIRNRDLTATNKIFEYLRSGLAVIATDTSGQLEVMERCREAGVIVRCNEHEELVTALQHFIDNREALASAQRAALKAATTTWAWDQFATRLSQSLKMASSQIAC